MHMIDSDVFHMGLEECESDYFKPVQYWVPQVGVWGLSGWVYGWSAWNGDWFRGRGGKRIEADCPTPLKPMQCWVRETQDGEGLLSCVDFS